MRNARAPPITPEAYGISKHTDAWPQDAAKEHRYGKEKYNQVKDPKQLERGDIKTRNCCINVNYVCQMCREHDCGEGMAAGTLNKRSSVECWMATPDHTIEREAACQPMKTERGFSQKTETEINVYQDTNDYLKR